MKIYYTLSEYRENYQNELGSFLDDYEDNECIDFWKEQRQLYKSCIENVTIIKSKTSDEFNTLAQINSENVIDEVYDKIHTLNSVPCIVDYDGKDVEILKDKVHYNFELAEKLKRSFEKILLFIEVVNSPRIEEESVNEMFDVLDKIRKNSYSNFELTKILKDLSNNYEVDLMQSILKDIEFYLFVETDIMESKFSIDDIEDAIQQLVERNIEIPYHKNRPIDSLSDKQKENRKKLEEKGFFSNPILNKEQLLFPFEFSSIYSFRNFINSKMKPKQTINQDLNPEMDLSSSNAVQKIIYLNELGIIDFLRKETCFALSVNNLANVITAITGEKHTTVQPYLNALLNKTGSENKNPYYTKSTVEKIKGQLINLGIKPM